MAETTDISWADATISYWIGCTKVGPACDACYAEVYGNRFGVKWGPREERRRTMHWLKKAKTIERRGKKLGKRQFVFSNSLSDIFDNAVPIEWLAEAFQVMAATPHNVYLLLTKRAGLIESRTREALALAGLDELPENIAFGITVVTQEEADRDIPKLLRAKAVLNPLFVFLSMEPLLERVNIMAYLTPVIAAAPADLEVPVIVHQQARAEMGDCYLDWVITGGESGAHARPSHIRWFTSLRDQCAEAGIPLHHKQNGEWVDHFHPAADRARATNKSSLGLRNHMATRTVLVGKDAAGRELEGVIHDARPEVRAA